METASESGCVGLGEWFRRHHLLVLGLLLGGMYLFGLPAAMRPVYGPLNEAERFLNALHHPWRILIFWHCFGGAAALTLALGLWDATRGGGRWAVREAGFPFWVVLMLLVLAPNLVPLPTWGCLLAVCVFMIVLVQDTWWQGLRRRWGLQWLRLGGWAGEWWVARHPWAALLAGVALYLLHYHLFTSSAWVSTIAHGALGHLQADMVDAGLSLVGVAGLWLVVTGAIGGVAHWAEAHSRRRLQQGEG